MEKSQHSRQYQRVTRQLRHLRETAGLTQADVAKKLSVYASFVSKVESGERRVDVVELGHFCRVYGIKLTDFLDQAGLT